MLVNSFTPIEQLIQESEYSPMASRKTLPSPGATLGSSVATAAAKRMAASIFNLLLEAAPENRTRSMSLKDDTIEPGGVCIFVHDKLVVVVNAAGQPHAMATFTFSDYHSQP